MADGRITHTSMIERLDEWIFETRLAAAPTREDWLSIVLERGVKVKMRVDDGGGLCGRLEEMDGAVRLDRFWRRCVAGLIN